MRRRRGRWLAIFAWLGMAALMTFAGGQAHAAISGTASQTCHDSQGSGTSLDCTLSAVTAGEAIHVGVAIRRAGNTNSSAATCPTGFSLVQEIQNTLSGNHNAMWCYKPATGGETTISVGIADDYNSAAMCVMVLPGTDVDWSTVAASTEDESNINTVNTSQDTNGGTGPTPGTANAIGVAFASFHQYQDWNGTPTWSDSYTSQMFEDSSVTSRAGCDFATRVISSAVAQDPTRGATDTGDKSYGANAVWDESAGGGPVTTVVGGTDQAYSNANENWVVQLSLDTEFASGDPTQCELSTGDEVSVVETGETTGCTDVNGTTKKCECTFDADDMVDNGTLNNTAIDTDYTVHLSNDIDADATADDLDLNGPTCSPPNCTQGSGVSACIGGGGSADCPADSDYPDFASMPGTDSFVEVGDVCFCRFIDSAGTSSGDGECNPDYGNVWIDSAGDARWQCFDIDASPAEWGPKLDVDYSAGDTTKPVLGTVTVTLNGLQNLATVSVPTTEGNGTAKLWLSTNPTATWDDCWDNGEARTVTQSPIVWASVGVEAAGFYTAHTCHRDAAGNPTSPSAADVASSTAIFLNTSDVCKPSAIGQPMIRSPLCEMLRDF